MAKKRSLSDSLKAIADKMAGQGEGAGVFDFEAVMNERPTSANVACDCGSYAARGEDKKAKIAAAGDLDKITPRKTQDKAVGDGGDATEVVIDALQTAIDKLKGNEPGDTGEEPEEAEEASEDDAGELAGDEISVPMPDSEDAMWHGDGNDAVGGQPFTCSATPVQIVATDCDGCEYNAEGGGKVDCQFPTVMAKGGTDPIDKFSQEVGGKAASKIAQGQELDVCSNCGFTEDHDDDIQTRDKVCPQCGGTMISKTASREDEMARRAAGADITELTKELIEGRPKDQDWSQGTEFEGLHQMPPSPKKSPKKTPSVHDIGESGLPPEQVYGMLATFGDAATRLSNAGNELRTVYKNAGIEEVIDANPLISGDISEFGKFCVRGASGVEYTISVTERSDQPTMTDVVHEIGLLAEKVNPEGRQFLDACADVIIQFAVAAREDKPPTQIKNIKPKNMPATTGIKKVDEALALVEELKKDIPSGYLKPKGSGRRSEAGIVDAIKRAWSKIQSLTEKALGLKEKATTSMEELIAVTERAKQSAGGAAASRRRSSRRPTARRIVARDIKGEEVKSGDYVRVVSREEDVLDMDKRSISGKVGRVVRTRSGYTPYPKDGKKRLAKIHEFYVVGAKRDWHGVVYGDEVAKVEPKRQAKRQARESKRPQERRAGPRGRKLAQSPTVDPELDKLIEEKAKEIAKKIKEGVDKELAMTSARRTTNRRPARKTADSYDEHHNEEANRVDTAKGKAEGERESEYQRRKKEWQYAKWAARRRRREASESEPGKPGTKSEFSVTQTNSTAPLDKWQKMSAAEKARRRHARRRVRAEEYLKSREQLPPTNVKLDNQVKPDVKDTSSTEPMSGQWAWKGVSQAKLEQMARREARRIALRELRKRAKDEDEDEESKDEKSKDEKSKDDEPKKKKGDDKPKGGGGESIEKQVKEYLDEHLEELVQEEMDKLDGKPPKEKEDKPEKAEDKPEKAEEKPEKSPEDELGADMDLELGDVGMSGDFGTDFAGGGAGPAGEDIIPFDENGNEFPKAEDKPEKKRPKKISVEDDKAMKERAAKRLARLMVKAGAAQEEELDEAVESIMDNHSLQEIREKTRAFREVAPESDEEPKRRRVAKRRPDRVELPGKGNSGLAAAARMNESEAIAEPSDNLSADDEFGFSLLGEEFGKGQTASTE